MILNMSDLVVNPKCGKDRLKTAVVEFHDHEMTGARHNSLHSDSEKHPNHFKNPAVYGELK